MVVKHKYSPINKAMSQIFIFPSLSNGRKRKLFWLVSPPNPSLPATTGRLGQLLVKQYPTTHPDVGLDIS